MLLLRRGRHLRHPRGLAEAAVLHRASGLPQPRYFLWFDSPFDAAWTVAMLSANHGGIWGRMIREASRSTPTAENGKRPGGRLPSPGRGGPGGSLLLYWSSLRLLEPRVSK